MFVALFLQLLLKMKQILRVGNLKMTTTKVIILRMLKHLLVVHLSLKLDGKKTGKLKTGKVRTLCKQIFCCKIVHADTTYSDTDLQNFWYPSLCFKTRR